jgi:hypothetical protein
MLLNDTAPALKYWVQTSQGLFGPYGTRSLAESASHAVPRMLNEVPQVLERTDEGKQLLLG